MNPRPASPEAEWRRRPRREAMPADEARRQGDISRLAFVALGKDAAIAFLNTDNPRLGGRPIGIATASADGELAVAGEIERLRRTVPTPDADRHRAQAEAQPG